MHEEFKAIVKRLENLEKDSHPSTPLCEFDDYAHLIEQIDKLEEWLTQKK